MWNFALEYLGALTHYWWVIGIGFFSAANNFVKLFHPHGKSLEIPLWMRVGWALAAIIAAQVLVYRDAIRNLNQVISDKGALASENWQLKHSTAPPVRTALPVKKTKSTAMSNQQRQTGANEYDDVIQVSLQCETTLSHQLPIEIPPKSNIAIVALNKERNAARSVFDPYSVPNYTARKMSWPDANDLQRLDEQSRSTRNFLPCKVANESDEQNLTGLNLVFEVQYANDGVYRPTALRIPLLKHGQSFQFYVLNDCMTVALFRLARTGTATIVGENTSRDFKVLNQQNSVATVQFFGSAGNWSGTTCTP